LFFWRWTTPAVSFFTTGLYPARSYFKQKKQRREIFVKAARAVTFELSSEYSFYFVIETLIESRLKPHPFFYVCEFSESSSKYWTDLSPLQRGSILIDRDRQELSNKNRIPKAYSHLSLLYLWRLWRNSFIECFLISLLFENNRTGYTRQRRLYQRRPVLPIVWLGVSLVAPEKPYPKEAYPTHRLTPKKGRQDNPSQSCIIEEERFSKSRRFLCVKNGDFLVFAGIPTWGIPLTDCLPLHYY
jgi:hypothetical protein